MTRKKNAGAPSLFGSYKKKFRFTIPPKAEIHPEQTKFWSHEHVQETMGYVSDDGFSSFAFRNYRHAESTIRALQNQLFMSSCSEEVADGPDQYKPSNNHKYI